MIELARLSMEFYFIYVMHNRNNCQYTCQIVFLIRNFKKDVFRNIVINSPVLDSLMAAEILPIC